jgi:hypothetical protein
MSSVMSRGFSLRHRAFVNGRMGSRSGDLRYRADMASKPPLLGTAREWAIELAVGAGLGVFLGVIGPFGSFSNGGASPRILHFVACFLVGTTIFGLLQRLAADWARRTGVPVWLALVVAVVIGCAPLSIFVGWMVTRIWPFLTGRLSPLDLYSQCLMLSAPVLAYMFFRQGVFKRTLPLPEAVEVAPDVQALAGAVICLRMEDHYVRVHTANGSRLVGVARRRRRRRGRWSQPQASAFERPAGAGFPRVRCQASSGRLAAGRDLSLFAATRCRGPQRERAGGG